MTPLPSVPPSALPSRGARLLRAARTVGVALAVGASATVVSAVPAQAAVPAAPAAAPFAPRLLLTKTIDGKTYRFSELPVQIADVGRYTRDLEVCETSIDGPQQSTCLNYRATFDTATEEASVTVLETGTVHGRRLMTGDHYTVRIRPEAVPVYRPGPLPDGATELGETYLGNTDLGFQRYRTAGGNVVVRMWAARSAGVVDGRPRTGELDLTRATTAERDRATAFMDQVREAHRQREAITNVRVGARWWVGLLGIGATAAGFGSGSSAVAGVVMSLGAVGFFVSPSRDAPTAMANAIESATDAFTALYGYTPVFEWDDHVA
jgi:hypothetical protein